MRKGIWQNIWANGIRDQNVMLRGKTATHRTAVALTVASTMYPIAPTRESGIMKAERSPHRSLRKAQMMRTINEARYGGAVSPWARILRPSR